jgi:hypothetical protein
MNIEELGCASRFGSGSTPKCHGSATLVREWERRMEDARAVGCEYSDTVLAHKLLAGARLHQATHALIGQCRKIFRHSAGS